MAVPLQHYSEVLHRRLIAQELNLISSYFNGLPASETGYSMVSDGDGSVSWTVPEDALVPLPRGYIDGLITANNATDANNDLDIGPGECRDADDTENIKLSAAITKQMDADWAEGDDAGGFPSGLTITNTWYRVFVISDGVNVDAGFDTDSAAANLLADATDYSYYRQIAWVRRTAGGAISPFYQVGDTFWFNPYFNSAGSGTSPGTSAVLVNLLTPPTEVEAILRVRLSHSTSAFVLYTPTFMTDIAPNSPNNTLAVSSGATIAQSEIRITADASQQIRVRSSVGSGLSANDFRQIGYVWRRGKDDS